MSSSSRVSNQKCETRVVDNEAIYREKVKEVFEEYSEEIGGWFTYFKKYDNVCAPLYAYTLFSGAPIKNNSELEFNTCCYYTIRHNSPDFSDQIKCLSRKAENKARVELGIPLIGEGWISETNLFNLLALKYFHTTVIQHGQPSWLGRQHFDIWFPNWRIAVEYHGKQHFEPVDFFGGVESLNKTIERDKRKADLAKNNGVTLLIVSHDEDFSNVVHNINSIIKNRNIELPVI